MNCQRPEAAAHECAFGRQALSDRKSTRLNSSHANISHAVFCLKKNKQSVPAALTLVDPNVPGPKLTVFLPYPRPARTLLSVAIVSPYPRAVSGCTSDVSRNTKS